MYNNSNNSVNFTPGMIKGVVWSVVIVVVLIVSLAFIRPWYNVWSQEMEGKAEFAKAEQNRKIKIEEAKANLEAEKLNAQAEVARQRCRRGYTYRERQHHTYLYPVSVGAPAVRPKR